MRECLRWFAVCIRILLSFGGDWLRVFRRMVMVRRCLGSTFLTSAMLG
jgi:hypothetical protein